MNPRPLHECQYPFIHSEAPPVLSYSSRKDEWNAAFPVSIGLPVWVLEEISSRSMVRANGTCHVPFRGHPDIDKNTFPSFACVERRRSGQNRFSLSVALNKFVKSRATWRGNRPYNIAVVGPGRTKSVRSKSVQPLEHKKQKNQNTCHVPMELGTWHGV